MENEINDEAKLFATKLNVAERVEKFNKKHLLHCKIIRMTLLKSHPVDSCTQQKQKLEK